MQLIASLALVSWFTGGVLLGLIEIITLPSDPIISTALQLLPLLLLIVGIWHILSKFQRVARSNGDSGRLKKAMIVGWIALFGVDAGVASVDDMSTQIFHTPIPHYFQGVGLAQKLTALTGIFILDSIVMPSCSGVFSSVSRGNALPNWEADRERCGNGEDLTHRLRKIGYGFRFWVIGTRL